QFARLKQEPNESDAAFKSRQVKEEADAREAVMTFILGLVAEPIPAKYVNASPPDRLAEVKGRQVLDKYNCASCHLIRPGVFEFKADLAFKEADKKKTDDLKASLDKLKKEGEAEAREFGALTDHTAWKGLLSNQP